MPDHSRSSKERKESKKKKRHKHKRSKRRCRSPEHHSKQEHTPSSVSYSSSSASPKSYSPKKSINKRKRRHNSGNAYADILAEYELDKDLFKPLAEFIDDRRKLCEEVLRSVDVSFVQSLFPLLKKASKKESVNYIYGKLKNIQRNEILSILQGEKHTYIPKSLNVSESLPSISSSQTSKNRTRSKPKRLSVAIKCDDASELFVDTSRCLHVSHARVEGEIMTYGIVDVNGDEIPLKKKHNAIKFELEHEESCHESGNDELNDSTEYISDQWGESKSHPWDKDSVQSAREAVEEEVVSNSDPEEGEIVSDDASLEPTEVEAGLPTSDLVKCDNKIKNKLPSFCVHGELIDISSDGVTDDELQDLSDYDLIE